jgi:acetyl-CoA carboxylase carboxyl transferase subunit alpha
MFATIKKTIINNLDQLMPLGAEKRISQRIKKFSNMGVVTA